MDIMGHRNIFIFYLLFNVHYDYFALTRYLECVHSLNGIYNIYPFNRSKQKRATIVNPLVLQYVIMYSIHVATSAMNV